MQNTPIKITEVGLRDGLQNEKQILSTDDKLQLLKLLKEAGLSHIEVTSFVRADKIPQLADAEEFSRRILPFENENFTCLVPNLKGYEKAKELGYKKIAIFGAASNTFTQKNINKTIEESFHIFEEVCKKALQDGIQVRAYISTIVECPYEGKISPSQVLEIVKKFFQLGVYEISLGETIGVAVPTEIEDLLALLLKHFPESLFACHFHDTYGMGISNTYQAYKMGIRSFDSSIGGLGGCPYAPGAAGNLATEDLVYFLERMGISTGINLFKLVEASQFVFQKLNKLSFCKTYHAISCKKSIFNPV